MESYEIINIQNQSFKQAIYTQEDLRVTSIIPGHLVSHFADEFPSGRNNLMASSVDGKFIFLAVGDCIRVYKTEEFDSKNPPNPESFFPFTPFRTLRPTPEQNRQLHKRSVSLQAPISLTRPLLIINNIRVGWIAMQESLVAVGEFGAVLIWDLKSLFILEGSSSQEPILMETSDFSSTWGIAISSKNRLIATSSNSHAVTLFHYPTRKVIFSLEDQQAMLKDKGIQVHTHNIPSLDFSPCGRWLTSCSIDGSVALWSIAERRVFRKNFHINEWGWLVRFIPRSIYPTEDDTLLSEAKTVKTFYNSSVPNEEVSNYEDVYIGLTTEYFGTETGSEDEDTDIEIENENAEENENHLNLAVHLADTVESYHYENGTSDFPFNGELINGEFLNGQLIRGEFHLSEDAGDTWAIDNSTEQDEEGYNYEEDWDDNFDIDNYDDEYDYDFDGVDTEDGTDNDTKYGTRDATSDAGDSSTDMEMDLTNQIEISLQIDDQNNLKNVNNLIFVDDSKSALTCPFDVCYCTSESLLIGDLSSNSNKIFIRSVKNRSLKIQGIDNVSFGAGSGIEFLQNRLAMGEWIPELNLFLAIDCNAHFILVSQNGSGKINLLSLPDGLFYSQGNVVGYTIIRRNDAEFGIKVHLYLMYEDSTFKLYEIARQLQVNV